MKLRMPDNSIGLSRGYSTSVPHLGVDFGWNAGFGGQNTTLYAAGDGTVTTLVNGYGNTYPNSRIYGNYLVINHGGGLETLYGHILNNSFLVKKGDKVKMGQAICKMNNSGYSNGSHLHFEVRINGNKVDPLKHTFVYPDQAVRPGSACKDQIQYYSLPEPQKPQGNPAGRDTSRLQIKINTYSLYGRKRPEINDEVILGFMREGIYTVLETRDMRGESSNGYIWYRVDVDLWCAGGDWLDVLNPQKEDINEDMRKIFEIARKYN